MTVRIKDTAPSPGADKWICTANLRSGTRLQFDTPVYLPRTAVHGGV